MSRAILILLLAACGNDSDADDLGVASECTTTEDCPVIDWAADSGDETQLECLTQFTGGYCALSPCASGADCPDSAICVAHTDGESYCFRSCEDKAECNVNRSEDSEANCSSNFDWADPADDSGERACIPPSSGT